jgi:hypothetical protein
MMSNKQTLLDGLMGAIKAERYGHNFYLMAANSTQDTKGKQVFETLASEELDHMRFLLGQYNAVLETGQTDSKLTLGRRLDLSGKSPIFSDSLKARVKEANFEMTSLSIGIQLEKDAMEYYQRQAEAAEDPDVNGFFVELSQWESGHYHALLRQQEELKEDFWSDAGFSPF